MMHRHNCFTFTCSKLDNLPNWGGWDFAGDREVFINDYKYFLKHDLHIKYFASFSDEVYIAKKGDIILSKATIGIAISHNKFQTIRERNGKIVIETITDRYTIMRMR